MEDQEGLYNNSIPELDKIDEYHLENIFKIYKNDQYFFFNLGKKINIPLNLEEGLYTSIVYNEQLLTTLSNNYYGTPSLWWIILYANGINNPLKMPANGTTLRIPNVATVRYILDKIQLSISETN